VPAAQFAPAIAPQPAPGPGPYPPPGWANANDAATLAAKMPITREDFVMIDSCQRIERFGTATGRNRFGTATGRNRFWRLCPFERPERAFVYRCNRRLHKAIAPLTEVKLSR
jgi:hypothetical protein